MRLRNHFSSYGICGSDTSEASPFFILGHYVHIVFTQAVRTPTFSCSRESRQRVRRLQHSLTHIQDCWFKCEPL